MIASPCAYFRLAAMRGDDAVSADPPQVGASALPVVVQLDGRLPVINAVNLRP